MFKIFMFPKAPKGPPHLACPLLSKQDFYCYLGLLKRKYASLRQSFFLFPVNFRIDMHHNVFYLRKCLFNAVMHHSAILCASRSGMEPSTSISMSA
jgi:hypothetical protein